MDGRFHARPNRDILSKRRTRVHSPESGNHVLVTRRGIAASLFEGCASHSGQQNGGGCVFHVQVRTESTVCNHLLSHQHCPLHPVLRNHVGPDHQRHRRRRESRVVTTQIESFLSARCHEFASQQAELHDPSYITSTQYIAEESHRASTHAF